MATAVYPVHAESIFERLIRPAILRLLAETDGSYRCERDLHHHFTVWLNGIEPLLIGTQQRLVSLEHPALACYGSGRKGNLDYFFHGASTGYSSMSNGSAVELNFNYRDGYKKIVQDMQKLIDPNAAYSECTYFAYGKKRRFFEEVVAGVGRVFEYFAEDSPTFRLPAGLHIIVAEYLRGNGHKVHETCVVSECTPSELQWTDTIVKQAGNERHDAAFPDNTHVSGLVTKLCAPESKLWVHWPSPGGPNYYLAFVNQFGSCSLRKFEAVTGRFIGPMRRDVGEFQNRFKTYLTSGQRLVLSRQPNLEKECRPKLPDWVLAELQGQVGTQVASAGSETFCDSEVHGWQ